MRIFGLSDWVWWAAAAVALACHLHLKSQGYA